MSTAQFDKTTHQMPRYDLFGAQKHQKISANENASNVLSKSIGIFTIIS